MEAAGEADDRRPARRRARDLDRVLDSLRAGAEEDRLLGALARRHIAQALGQAQVGFVHHDLERGVRGVVELVADRGHDARVVVADVHDADAADEVDVTPAGRVPDLGAQRMIGDERVRGRDAARHVSLA